MRDKNERYRRWIAAYVARRAVKGGLLHQCREATLEMSRAFPELKRVAGRVELADGKRWVHAWMVAPDGELLDPTVLQFESAPVRYTPADEEDPKPTGQCFECMDYRYGRSRYCSEKCGRAFRKRAKANPGLEMAIALHLLGIIHSEMRGECGGEG